MTSINKKTYKNVDEQIIYLKENKKIIVNNEDSHYLVDNNYISIINPYKELFFSGRDSRGNHIYSSETNFSKFIEMHKIDMSLSKYLYEKISVFERKFKNAIIASICDDYNLNGDNECIGYIKEIEKFLGSIKHIDDTTNIESYELSEINDQFLASAKSNLPSFCNHLFDSVSDTGMVLCEINKINIRIDLLKNIYELGCGLVESKNELISHYIESQWIVPFWAISNALTLGDITKIFEMLDEKKQYKIVSLFINVDASSSEINYINIRKFTDWLEYIRKLRNKICHFEPLFPFFVKYLGESKNITYNGNNKKINHLRSKQIHNLYEKPVFHALHDILDKDIVAYEHRKYNESFPLKWNAYESSNMSSLGIPANSSNTPYIQLMEFLKSIPK